MATLAHDLLGSTRSAVLAALLLHPDEALHVRELARLTGASPGSLHRELRSLSELGLLIRQVAGRQVFYRANRDCPVFDELAGLLRKTSGVADVLRDALAPLAGQIDGAFVYGSMASGRETGRSNVDVMVLERAGFADITVRDHHLRTVSRFTMEMAGETYSMFFLLCMHTAGAQVRGTMRGGRFGRFYKPLERPMSPRY